MKTAAPSPEEITALNKQRAFQEGARLAVARQNPELITVEAPPTPIIEPRSPAGKIGPKRSGLWSKLTGRASDSEATQ